MSKLGKGTRGEGKSGYWVGRVMPLIFSYGTLQTEKVQLATFGRLLNGQQDELPEYAPATVEITDPHVAAKLGQTYHANAKFNGNENLSVAGTAFMLTDEELAAADAYEAVFQYHRVAVVLASGKQAWVYVHAQVDW